MPNQLLRIDGLNEAISFLSTFPSSLNSKVDTEMAAIADKGSKQMKNDAHRQTGRMANSISVKKGKGKVDINVAARYAGYENNRGNPHNFFSKNITVIDKDAKVRIPRLIDTLLASRGR